MSNSVTPLAELLRHEIEQDGPVPFSRFMDVALYHPEHGYYRRERDPFGTSGDFYTAEQLQPVFGRIIARFFESLSPPPPSRTLVEPGAGRREMTEGFSAFDYIPIDGIEGMMPPRFSGFVFANEFLDALPVDVAVKRAGEWRELRVGCQAERFFWIEGGPVTDATRDFLAEASSLDEEGGRAEVCLAALNWMQRLAGSLETGHILLIDYGYTRREAIRFPQGTLMSYRGHQAHNDVLAEPGERDITAHVAFSAIEAAARRAGFEVVRLESMASLLLRAGEADQFASALAADNERAALRLRMQLKTLLFGMGETFRALLLRKE